MEHLTDDGIIDLDALALPVARVKLFGAVHDVLPADGAVTKLLAQLDEDAKSVSLTTSTETARRIVAISVPTLADEQRERLSAEQLTALIQLVTRQVETVRSVIARALGTDGGPET